MIKSKKITTGIILSLILTWNMSCNCKKVLTTRDLTEQQLEQSIESGVDYLINSITPNGQFTYIVNIDPNAGKNNTYNILRHAGVIYALASYAAREKDVSINVEIEKTINFLKIFSINYIAGNKNMLAVWSRPDISRKRKVMQAKLGGSGLALVALTTYEKVAPGMTDIEYLRKIARFILYMQKKDGSFYSKYLPSKGGRDDSWTSLYYPGEAALGLVMLYELDPSPLWLNSALKAMGYLCKLRKKRTYVEPDHWALLATARLLAHYDKSDKSIPKEELFEHSAKICRTMISSYNKYPEDSMMYGCLSNDYRTAPTATRLEGLLAAYSFLPEKNQKLRGEIKSIVEAGLVFLMRAQIKEGTWKGGITRELVTELPKDNKATHSNNRRTEIRIDYIQHAISAMMQYLDLF